MWNIRLKNSPRSNTINGEKNIWLIPEVEDRVQSGHMNPKMGGYYSEVNRVYPEMDRVQTWSRLD